MDGNREALKLVSKERRPVVRAYSHRVVSVAATPGPMSAREEHWVVAIVILRPEEAAIAVSGSLHESNYRPFPGSARERELEKERERAEARYVDDIEDEDRSASSSPASLFAPVTSSRTLPRIGAAQTWKRYSMEVALLVAERENELQLVALGTVEGGARTAIRGVRNLEVRVRFVVNDFVTLAGVRAALARREQVLLDQILRGELRPLSPTLGENLLREIVKQKPGLGDIVRAIRGQTNDERVARARLRQPRRTALTQEAMSSALRFFGTMWHTLTREPAPGHPSSRSRSKT